MGTPPDPQSVFDANRPVDMTFITDEIISRGGDATDLLFGAVDSTRIGLGGYSYGVPTIVGTITGVGPNNVTVPADPRADAALFIDQRDITQMERPLLHVGGADDDFSSIPTRATRATPLYGFDVDNVHHWSFGTLLCQYYDELVASNAPQAVFDTVGDPANWPGCQPGLIDPQEAQELLAQQAIDFFDAHVKNTQAIQPNLVPRTGEIEDLVLFAELADGNGAPDGLPLELLLTDPLGRRLGIDPVTHQVVNDFNTGSFNAGARHTFVIGGDELVAGAYQVEGRALDSQSGAELELESLILGMANPHERNTAIRFRRSLVPNTPVEVMHFDIFAPGVCDFDGDGSCAIEDLNALLANGPLVTRRPAAGIEEFDLNADGFIDSLDVDEWLTVAADAAGLGSPYQRGDANLDGVVDGLDFILWNASKFSQSLEWDAGDFNLDGVVDGADFIFWNSNKFTSSDGTSAVPEPGLSGLSMLGLSLLGLVSARRLGPCRQVVEADGACVHARYDG